MTRFLFVLLFVTPVLAFGQKKVNLQVLSVADSNPVPDFYIKYKKDYLQSDSAGFIVINTKEKKIKLSYGYSWLKAIDGKISVKSIDTIISITELAEKIKIYTVLTNDSLQAKYDVKHGILMLHCSCDLGLAPHPLKVEKGVDVMVYNLSDFLPGLEEMKRLRSYNAVVGEYLESKYGSDWKNRAINMLECFQKRNSHLKRSN